MNRILITILFFCFAAAGNSCSQKANITPENPTSFWDCGEYIPKGHKIPFPVKPLGYTSDFEHIFTDEQIAVLDSMMGSFEKETTDQLAVVTIDSAWTTKEDFDSYTLNMANNWGVGQKGKNNGILIGICKSLRMIRINNGSGIEAKLSDAETKSIIDNVILSEFKEEHYFEGTRNGLLALMKKIR